MFKPFSVLILPITEQFITYSFKQLRELGETYTSSQIPSHPPNSLTPTFLFPLFKDVILREQIWNEFSKEKLPYILGCPFTLVLCPLG